MKLLYKLFYKGFLRYQKSTIKPKEMLVYGFTDVEGKNYYTFKDKGTLPMCRYNRLADLMMWWAAKISPETLESLSNAIIIAIGQGLEEKATNKRFEHLGNAIHFAKEITLRRENGIPSPILHEMAALFSIREDENPVILDPIIHEQKIQALTYETAIGRDFFLKLPTLLEQLLFMHRSSEELRKQFSASVKEEKIKQEIVSRYLYGQQSQKPKEVGKALTPT